MTVPIIPDLSRLKRRLAALLAAAVLVLSAVSALYYSRYRASLRADAESLLLSTSQIKLDQLLNWRRERLSDAMLLSESPAFAAYASRLGHGAPRGEAASLARKRLGSYLKYKRYPFGALVDRDGRVLVYAGEKPAVICPQFKNLVPAARAAGRAQMGDFYLSEDSSPHIDIVAPVGAGPGLLLLLRVNPADYLYPLLQTWSARGDTGEILLVTRDGDNVLFLNDLRHVRGAAMRLRRPVNDPDLPAAMGLRGFRGVAAGVDYRGVKVLAAISPVPGTGWAMVTKKDWREVMKSSAAVAVLLVLVLLSLLAGAGAWAFLLFRRQAEVYESSYSEHLSRLNERLTLAARAGRLGVWDWDVKANVLTWDDGMYALYGIRREDFKGAYEAWLSAIHPEDKARSAEETRLALSGEKPYDTEFRVRLPDGSVRHIKADAAIYRDADGKPVRMLGVNQDVTAQRRDEGINASRASLLQYAADHSIDELLEETLNEAEKLTDSRIGFYHFLDEDRKSLTLQNWSTATKRLFCKAEGKGAHYDIAKAGVWVECFYKREPVIHNDYASLPAKKGLPEGHASVVRELVVPVLRGGKIRAILGVGNKSALYDAEDVRVVSLLADLAWEIAERKMAEDALRASELSLKEAQRLARIGNWTLELPSNRLSWSDEIYRIFEIDKEKFGASYDAFLDAIHPADRDFVNKAYTDSLKDRTPYDIEHRLLMKDGRVKYVSESCETSYNPDGSPRRSVGTVQDITERKMAEQALRESEKAVRRKLDAILSPDMDMSRLELSDIIDSAKIQNLMDRFYAVTRIGVAVIDMKGKVLVATGWQEICTKFHRVNPETCRLCVESDLELSRGVPAGETKLYQCRNHMWDMVTPIMLGDIHVGNIFLGQFLFEGEEPDLGTFRGQAARYGFDEEKYLAALNAVPRWSRATVDAAMAFYASFAEVFGQLSFSNIKLANTLEERNRAQAELEKTAKALREKNQEMENFLYITTHDLRSPLVNIQGFSQNIERYLKELRDALGGLPVAPEEKTAIDKLAGEKMPAALEYVLSGSRKMDALITALLKVSRAGRVDMRPEKVDAGEVLKKVADAMRFQLQQCGAELKLAALPSCWADPGAVSQVFSNLVDNAVKYRDEGRAPVIEVSGERNGDKATYRVSDNGPGIPAKDLDRIWNVFYSHGRAGPRKGEGIGLPMVKRLVEKNNGSIKAEAAPGQGISFVIELPAVEGK